MGWLSLSSCLLLASAALAETGEDYFHAGTQFYVFGEKEKATERVTTGLQKFPNDPKLNGLAMLLKKEEQQQQQQQNQNKDQQNKDQQNKDKKNQQQNKQDQKQQQDKNQDQKKQQQDQAKKDQNKDAKDQKQQSQAQKDDKKQDEQEGQPVEPGKLAQMTPEQAKQFLEAMKQEDRTLIFKQPEQEARPKALKDW